MRSVPFLLLFANAGLFAQPQPPPISFTLAADLPQATPLTAPYRIELHFKYVPQYGFGEHMRGEAMSIALQTVHLFADTTSGWRLYRIPETWDTRLRVLVLRGTDTMQLDLPEAGVGRSKLIDRAWSRWDRATPEVIRFRPGHFAFAEVITDAWAVAPCKAIAQRLIAEEEVRYKKQLHDQEQWYRDHPTPPAIAAPTPPPPPMTPEQWEAEMAKQPALREARIIGVNIDTVTISFTGRVMLTGGCASNSPTFGIEQRINSDWEERFPLDHTQLDCGMPWADWAEHAVTIPLRWWVGNFAPAGRKELNPGTYRLVFMGGNMQEMRTEAFTLD